MRRLRPQGISATFYGRQVRLGGEGSPSCQKDNGARGESRAPSKMCYLGCQARKRNLSLCKYSVNLRYGRCALVSRQSLQRAKVPQNCRRALGKNCFKLPELVSSMRNVEKMVARRIMTGRESVALPWGRRTGLPRVFRPHTDLSCEPAPEPSHLPFRLALPAKPSTAHLWHTQPSPLCRTRRIDMVWQRTGGLAICRPTGRVMQKRSRRAGWAPLSRSCRCVPGCRAQVLCARHERRRGFCVAQHPRLPIPSNASDAVCAGPACCRGR